MMLTLSLLINSRRSGTKLIDTTKATSFEAAFVVLGYDTILKHLQNRLSNHYSAPQQYSDILKNKTPDLSLPSLLI
jgi:FKBP-type peptidyl-prolyl cis-trans isomerase 2